MISQAASSNLHAGAFHVRCKLAVESVLAPRTGLSLR
jgi:hypothetical protein